MLEGDDIPFFCHDTFDEIWTICEKEGFFYRFEVSMESFKHFHDVLEKIFYHFIEEKSCIWIGEIFIPESVSILEFFYGISLKISECHEIFWSDKYIEFI